MTLRQKIQQELAQVEEMIARGKGTWPEPSYVRDETWARWESKQSTLECLLRHEDPTPSFDDLMEFLADFSTKFIRTTSYDPAEGVFRRYGMWRCDGSHIVPADQVFTEAVQALEQFKLYPNG